MALYLRLRASGSDTSTNYFRAGWYVANGGSSGGWYTANPGTEIVLVDAGTTLKSALVDVFNPQRNVVTNFQGSSRSDGQSNTFGGHQSATTQFDSFNLFPSAGTINGSVSVYGYNK
jgi:hypothetical protein